MFTEQLPDLLNYINNIPRVGCLNVDMNINLDDKQQSLIKQTLTILSLYNVIQVSNKPKSKCGFVIDWVLLDQVTTFVKINSYRLTLIKPLLH